MTEPKRFKSICVPSIPSWTGLFCFRDLDRNDSIGDIEIAEEGGRVLVFNKYDSYAARFPDVAWSVLDILEINSRRLLLFGRRLIVLVQSDDPEISFERVGGRPVS